MDNIPEVAKALPAELSQATVNPEQYAAAVIAPFQSALAQAIAEDVTDYDVSTTAGMKLATARRAVFRDIRIGTDKERAARKAPLLEIGRLLDANAKALIAETSKHEERHDSVIKAEEARKAAERAEKERIERERIARIHEYIADINAIPSKLVGKSADEIRAALAEAEAMEIDIDVFADFTGTAMQARLLVVTKLIPMLAAQEEHEAEQERLKAERAELARQQAEQRRIDAEAAAERLAQEEAARVRREAEEAAFRESMAEQMKAQQAELQRQQEAARAEAEELARKQEAFRQEQEAARLAAEAKAAELEPELAPEPEPITEPAVATVHDLNQVKPAGVTLSRHTMTRPSDMAMVSTLAMHYRVHEVTIVDWLQHMDLHRVLLELEKEFA